MRRITDCLTNGERRSAMAAAIVLFLFLAGVLFFATRRSAPQITVGKRDVSNCELYRAGEK